jgi:hypothetical protein
VVSRAVSGCLDEAWLADGCLELAGWAVDLVRREAATSVLVFVDGALLYSGRPNAVRADVAASLGAPAFERAGFSFALPLEWLEGRADPEVRLFALSSQGAATELKYPAWYRTASRRPLSARSDIRR